MPTNKPRITFALSDEMFAQIENFRFNNKCKNQSQAILALIEKGFQAIMNGAEIPAIANETQFFTDAEFERLSAAMDCLNDKGRERVIEYAEDLAACGRYNKDGGENTKTDLIRLPSPIPIRGVAIARGGMQMQSRIVSAEEEEVALPPPYDGDL